MSQFFNFMAERLGPLWAVYIAAGLIVVLGLFVYGLADLKRFSLTRAWAIGKVCTRDAIRRRVLWITPVAFLGVVVVSQLQRPVDAQDTIRQTIQASIFVTTLVVALTALILASTNLPREIENKVIFTVVTKPTTRLEIVVGKIIGFAKVSALILAILGGLNFAYLEYRAFALRQSDQELTLSATSLDPSKQLLSSRSLSRAREIQFGTAPSVLAKLGNLDAGRRWMIGAYQEMLVPYELSLADVTANNSGKPEDALEMQVAIDFDAAQAAADPSRPLVQVPQPPPVQVVFLDAQGYTLVGTDLVPPATWNAAEKRYNPIPLSPKIAAGLGASRKFMVQVTGGDPFWVFGAGKAPVSLRVKAAPDKLLEVPPRDTLFDSSAMPAPVVRGKSGNFGSQLRGPEEGMEMVGTFKFRNQPAPDAIDGKVPVQFRAGIERSGADAERETVTDLELTVVNVKSGKSYPAFLQPESNRTKYAAVPAEAFEGGDYDVVVKNVTAGHVVGLTDGTLTVVTSQRGFAVNMLLSHVVLWLFSVLVVSIAIFCSTFVSWPIAIILTLLAILGNWGVRTLGDSLGAGIGNQVAQTMFANDASKARVVSDTVEALAATMRTLGSLLPDTSVFDTGPQLERGLTVQFGQLAQAGLVVLLFALPAMVLGYVILRNKEVAP
jgi:ABC-type transport system involved in multi-copper enzyme maturation permease subunit